MRRVFKRKEDPFNFEDSAYETERYEAMESYLQRRTYAKVLEVGCAEGQFTRRLLPLCRELVVIDISKRAIERCRARLNSPKRRGVVANVRDWRPRETFNLLVFGDVVYYLGSPQKGRAFGKAQDEFCARAVSWLEPGPRQGSRALLARSLRASVRLIFPLGPAGRPGRSSRWPRTAEFEPRTAVKGAAQREVPVMVLSFGIRRLHVDNLQ